MKTEVENKEYTKKYYEENRKRLCKYSAFYYKLKSNDLNLLKSTDEDFLKFYNNYKKHTDIKKNKLKICKNKIIISFN